MFFYEKVNVHSRSCTCSDLVEIYNKDRGKAIKRLSCATHSLFRSWDVTKHNFSSMCLSL